MPKSCPNAGEQPRVPPSRRWSSFYRVPLRHHPPGPPKPENPAVPRPEPPPPAEATTAEPSSPSPQPVPVVTAVSEAMSPVSPPGELSTEELVGVMLVLQRKVKVLQQRHRRHRARLEAMEGLLERLRREERRKVCLQPVSPDPAGSVTVICREEEEQELGFAVPPPAGTACDLGLEQP